MKYKYDCYVFIKEYIEANNGLSPSLREIAKAVGCSSVSTINRTIDRLVDEGYLEKRRRTPRSVRIVKDLY